MTNLGSLRALHASVVFCVFPRGKLTSSPARRCRWRGGGSLRRSPPRHRFQEQLGQGPDQRVDAVGRIAGDGAVEIRTERAHLILERREGAEMVHPPLLVERG